MVFVLLSHIIGIEKPDTLNSTDSWLFDFKFVPDGGRPVFSWTEKGTTGARVWLGPLIYRISILRRVVMGRVQRGLGCLHASDNGKPVKIAHYMISYVAFACVCVCLFLKLKLSRKMNAGKYIYVTMLDITVSNVENKYYYVQSVPL